MSNIIKKIKNVISLILFVVFIGIFLFDYHGKKIIFSKIESINESLNVEKENSIIENDLLDKYYTESNINLSNILVAKDDENKEKLVDLLNRFTKEKIKEISGDERREMLKKLDGTLILGDSQVAHIKYSGALDDNYLAYMPGLTLLEQLDKIDGYLRDDIKTIILWNGYNIYGFKDSNEFLDAYKKIVDKIHAYNKDIKIYVCSLLPARKDAIYKDLQNDAKHNVYKGPEYDQALREYFSKDNSYININFLVRDDFYTDDGVHFNPNFNFVLVPYLTYYINLSIDEDNVVLDEEMWRVATNSIITLGNFYNIKRKELVEAPLRFKIIENNGKEITCISYDIIDNIPYAKEEKCSYKDSYLRKYLNEYFYKSCFTDEEKKIMKAAYIENGIKDYVTSLSYKEYKNYKKKGISFTTDNSEFSHEKVDKIENSYVTLAGNVWLRDSYYIAYHYTDEYKVMHLSYPYEQFSYGVRPVIKLDINKYLSYIKEEHNNIKEKADYDKFYLSYFGEENYGKDAYESIKSHNKKILLTFDDGPSELTNQVLDILDKYNVKATFFLCDYGYKDKETIRRIIDSGHTIGIHCYSHFYEKLYVSKEMFIENIETLKEKLKKDFGINPMIMRFPGGSANELSITYNEGIMSDLIGTMHEKGYEFYDWNITSGDADPRMTKENIISNVMKSVNPFRESVILFHDSKEHYNTIEALPSIIEYFIKENYSIEKIDDKSLPIYKYAVN